MSVSECIVCDVDGVRGLYRGVSAVRYVCMCVCVCVCVCVYV